MSPHRDRTLGGAARAGRADERLVHEHATRRAAAAPRPDPRRARARASHDALEQRRHRRALRPPGATRCSSAFEAPTIVTTGTASGKSLCFQLPTLEVLDTDPRRARAVPVPDQGARPGPGARAARLRAAPSRSARRSTTATRRAQERAAIRKRSEPRDHQPRHAARRDPAPPRARGATCSRTSRSSSSTRRTSTAACSARTSPTSCAGCAGPPRSTAPSRASCSPARRSPTRSSWPSSLTGLEPTST